MRSRWNFKVTPQEVQGHAERFLTPVLGKGVRGLKCTTVALIQVVLVAASRMLSIFTACLSLRSISDQAVRQGLRACLPKRARLLEARLNQAFVEPLPKKARRRARTLAVDLHEIPYHGEALGAKHLLHKKPRAGTTKFFAYATICLLDKGYRYTLGFTWVQAKESDTAVLARLLPCVERSGIKIRRLLLDRGFFNVALIKFLQTEQIPFLLPVVFRGRKPRPGKRYTGLRAFLRKAAGWYKHTHAWRGEEVTFRVCVAYKSYRHHRTHRRCSKKLVFACSQKRGTPTQLREDYRRRFGIETSYRQLGQARIRTSTRDPLLRLFFVGVALLLRNLWVWLQWLLLGQPDPEQFVDTKRFPLKGMLENIARVIDQHIRLEVS